jgi:leucyl/phenylalanyl-tRNA---protein transferase
LPVPIEPPPTRWRFPPADDADEHGIVAVGGDLEPGTILAAYRQALFPMPAGRGGPMAWWSPDPRGVLPFHAFRRSRSLRRSARRFEVRVDTAFAEVVDACADPHRPAGWISDDIRTAYVRLHELGWAHSVETWDGGGLAGGLYGVAIGGLFAGESMFFRRTDASKVALSALVELLTADPDDRRLLDVQWATPHLMSLGAVEVARSEYHRRLARALTARLPALWGDP